MQFPEGRWLVTGADVMQQAKQGLKKFVRRLLLPVKNEPPTAAGTKWQQWSIGIFLGESPLRLAPAQEVTNPIISRKDITDVPAAFVADPFMLRVDDIWYMFFEVVNQQAGKGEIGLAISQNGLRWAYQQIVLAEPFHLSYPYVFEWLGDYYMIPESHEVRSVRLYKADKFPTQWSLVKNLIDGQTFNDPSTFHHQDKWWLFVETAPVPQCDTLRLYYADDLLGPWVEHPKSPIIKGDPHIARPAGRVIVLGDRIFRYAQDCYPNYGMLVRAFEINELTVTAYSEREVSESPILAGSGTGWNESGMHHIDAHPLNDGQWIACVDGSFWQ